MKNRLLLYVTLFVLAGVFLYLVFTGNNSMAKFEVGNFNKEKNREVKTASIQESNLAGKSSIDLSNPSKHAISKKKELENSSCGWRKEIH